jgi:hypothetical protein
MMAAAQVMGNDLAITIGNQHGNFALNTMLPLIAHNLLQSITLLANPVRLLADKAIATMTVHVEHMAVAVEKNPILVTALTPVLGYDRAAQIAKQCTAEGRRVKDVAAAQQRQEFGALCTALLERSYINRPALVWCSADLPRQPSSIAGGRGRPSRQSVENCLTLDAYLPSQNLLQCAAMLQSARCSIAVVAGDAELDAARRERRDAGPSATPDRRGGA